MSVSIVFQQMIIIFALIAVGFIIARKRIFSSYAASDLSKLITDICNPALLICSAFDKDGSVTDKDLLFTVVVVIIYYIVLIGISMIIPRIIKAKKEEFKSYKMISVYSNIGFMGIPLISAVMGSSAVIYLSIFIIAFNLLAYTHGITVLTNEGEDGGRKINWKRMINPGTIASVITIIIFSTNIKVPMMAQDTLNYLGRCTTFLSMAVIGMALAQIPAKELFSEYRLYLFSAIRYVIVPTVAAFCLKPFIHNDVLLGVLVFTLALPPANISLMLAKQYNVDERLFSKGIVLTTILSVLTVTIASWVLVIV
jgi:Predicted permeases